MTPAQASIPLIDSIITLLEQMDDARYCQCREIFDGSTFAAHMRHVLEFYQLVIQAEKSSKLDFASRHRDLRYEQSTQNVITGFDAVKSALSSLDHKQSIVVIGDLHSSGDESYQAHSTIGRELIYAYDHAIHHMAIVKMGLRAECPDIAVDSNIGVAASTIKFRSLNN